jgi:hypothetical protein
VRRGDPARATLNTRVSPGQASGSKSNILDDSGTDHSRSIRRCSSQGLTKPVREYLRYFGLRDRVTSALAVVERLSRRRFAVLLEGGG